MMGTFYGLLLYAIFFNGIHGSSYRNMLLEGIFWSRKIESIVESRSVIECAGICSANQVRTRTENIEFCWGKS